MSAAEETGLKLALSETPKTGFVARLCPINTGVHEISLLTTCSASGKNRDEAAHMRCFQNLCCSHTQNMNGDKDSDQNVDTQPIWICKHGQLKEVPARMRYIPNSLQLVRTNLLLAAKLQASLHILGVSTGPCCLHPGKV